MKERAWRVDVTVPRPQLSQSELRELARRALAHGVRIRLGEATLHASFSVLGADIGLAIDCGRRRWTAASSTLDLSPVWLTGLAVAEVSAPPDELDISSAVHPKPQPRSGASQLVVPASGHDDDSTIAPTAPRRLQSAHLSLVAV